MGNGASSSQGSLPSYDKRDVGTSVDGRKQHDWQPEQAEAPKQEIHSLQVETRKPYICNNRAVTKRSLVGRQRRPSYISINIMRLIVIYRRGVAEIYLGGSTLYEAEGLEGLEQRGFLGRRQRAGDAVISPSGVPCGAPTANAFWTYKNRRLYSGHKRRLKFPLLSSTFLVFCQSWILGGRGWLGICDSLTLFH